jgi:hypothetical protein
MSTVLPENPDIKRAYERGKDTLDFERARHRARAAIDFIEARATDIAPNLHLEQWQKEAILELFEIGPEAMFKQGARVDHVV